MNKLHQGKANKMGKYTAPVTIWPSTQVLYK